MRWAAIRDGAFTAVALMLMPLQQRPRMIDLIFLLLAFGSFLALGFYVRFCERQ